MSLLKIIEVRNSKDCNSAVGDKLFFGLRMVKLLSHFGDFFGMLVSVMFKFRHHYLKLVNNKFGL